jgi:hypothetical protein
MNPRQLFLDERLTGRCVYCGAQPDTRDHSPSKVLLDKPYPPQLPTVEACGECNASFSLDEQYLACFIECVISGTVETSSLKRINIKRILEENPALLKRIKNSRRRDEANNLLWEPEIDRVKKVVPKLARGHVAYELVPRIEEPVEIAFAPLHALNEEERAKFEHPISGNPYLLPEIGSRAFLRVFGKSIDKFERSGDWIMVQPSRYRYAIDETAGVLVRMILSEYLACLVFWKE